MTTPHQAPPVASPTVHHEMAPPRSSQEELEEAHQQLEADRAARISSASSNKHRSREPATNGPPRESPSPSHDGRTAANLPGGTPRAHVRAGALRPGVVPATTGKWLATPAATPAHAAATASATADPPNTARLPSSSPGGTLVPAPVFNHLDIAFQTGRETTVPVPVSDEDEIPEREDIFRQDL